MQTSTAYTIAQEFMQTPPACFFVPGDQDTAAWPVEAVRQRLGWPVDIDWYLTLCELEQCGYYRDDPRGLAFWEAHGPDCLGDECPTCASAAQYVSALGVVELLEVEAHIRAVHQPLDGLCTRLVVLRAHLREACQGEEDDGGTR